MKLDLANLRSFPAPVRLLVFTLLLLLLWLPIALPLRFLIHDANLAGIVTLVILYAEFIWLVRRWGRQVHERPNIFWDYGLEVSRHIGIDVAIGLGIGLASILILFGLQTALGWVAWQTPTLSLVRILAEGLLVALALGFAEELLFRGWMLDELQRDYVPAVAMWADAALFATLHFRLITFPALLLLGVALIWAKRSRSGQQFGRRRDLLGLPIGLHAGLVGGNYILEVGKLITYTNRVPMWITGIDRNPLAGVMGILFLGALALGMRQFAKRQRPTRHW